MKVVMGYNHYTDTHAQMQFEFQEGKKNHTGKLIQKKQVNILLLKKHVISKKNLIQKFCSEAMEGALAT